MRWRLPGVPENWKVACTTYGCSFSLNGMRCVKNVCPLQNMDTGRMPNLYFPSYPLQSQAYHEMKVGISTADRSCLASEVTRRMLLA